MIKLVSFDFEHPDSVACNTLTDASSIAINRAGNETEMLMNSSKFPFVQFHLLSHVEAAMNLLRSEITSQI